MPTVISLFSGVGGLDYGFEAGGFETRVLVDIDHNCCESLRTSRTWPVHERALENTPSSDILLAAGLNRGESDVLIGHPPCGSYSGTVSKSNTLLESELGTKLWREYLRILRETMPRTFVIAGLAATSKYFENLILPEIEKINSDLGTSYQPSLHILKAANYGVPINKSYCFIVADREGKIFSTPAETHAVSPNQVNGLKPWTTAWDAIGGIENLRNESLSIRGKWGDLVPSIPEGENYLWLKGKISYDSLFSDRRDRTHLYKLSKSGLLPAFSVNGSFFGPFHWDNRQLSTAELKALLTFPETACIAGTRTQVIRQLSSAIPPLLAEVIARELAVQLLGLSSDSNERSLLPIVKRPIPEPEPVIAIPSKFVKQLNEQHFNPLIRQGELNNDWEQELFRLFRIVEDDNFTNSTNKGDALTDLVYHLLDGTGIFYLEKKKRTGDAEFDIVARRKNEAFYKFIPDRRSLFLFECKYYEDPVGHPDFTRFQSKVSDRIEHCNLGFLIAWNGFNKNVNTALIQQRRQAAQIACMTKNGIRRAIEMRDIATVLQDLYFELPFIQFP